MSKKLLIDARQSDETRVVVLNNNKLEDFDYETSHRKQLKGNIYLARVTRVEPSLQAAFVEYGGNRQGFLAFSEIHPDYYRIPVEDREKLLAEEEDRANAEAAADDPDESNDADNAEADDSGNDDASSATIAESVTEETVSEDAPFSEEASDDNSDENPEENSEEDSEEKAEEKSDEKASTDDDDNDDADDEDQASRRKHARISKHYKIQEVISRRQILLVQVVKEERGNKGAALTTYLSLAGRYCVLMPNTFHGGGVSRKISNPADRKKLKTIVNSLEVPKGNAVIVRTAGAKRTKAEITRDFTYLMRQWDDIRTLTMESSAPSLIHEEGNLIKRSIRDYYGADVDEILVEGEEAHKAAKTHMRNLMPSHVKKVKSYEDTNLPLFQRYQVESMLSAMHEPQVTLKSGGYLVINQTEALVAIDVNSGRATRERNIEETARLTNLEAAEEIATQLRQRDLSGLIVIDFIDMENTRNQHAVERKLKESLKNDRARIQVGSISQFGLLEMSRQRLRPSLAEAVTDTCPHCNGTGRIRSVESAALQVLRAIEAEALKGKGDDLKVFMNAEIAIYILNHKHDIVMDLRERFGINITLDQDNSLIAPDVRFGEDGAPLSQQQEAKENNNNRRRRRGKNQQQDQSESTNEAPERPSSEDQEDEDKPRRRRRGRRGGRRRRGRDQNQEAGAQENQNAQSEDNTSAPSAQSSDAPAETAQAEAPAEPPAETVTETSSDNDAPKAAKKAAKKAVKKKKAAKKAAKKAKAKAELQETSSEDEAAPAAKKAAKKKKASKKKKKTAAANADTPSVKEKAPKAAAASDNDDSASGREASSSVEVNVVDVSDVKPASKKKGWWS